MRVLISSRWLRPLQQQQRWNKKIFTVFAFILFLTIFVKFLCCQNSLHNLVLKNTGKLDDLCESLTIDFRKVNLMCLRDNSPLLQPVCHQHSWLCTGDNSSQTIGHLTKQWNSYQTAHCKKKKKKKRSFYTNGQSSFENNKLCFPSFLNIPSLLLWRRFQSYDIVLLKYLLSLYVTFVLQCNRLRTRTKLNATKSVLLLINF